MSEDRKPIDIIADGKIDPEKMIYQLTVIGIPTLELLKEYAIKMGAASGAALSEVMGRPAVKEYAGGLAPDTSVTGGQVERVSASQVEDMIRRKMMEADTCPCPGCVARRARENKNQPDPNLRH